MLSLPLYYTGISNTALVYKEGAASPDKLTLQRDYSVEVTCAPVCLPRSPHLHHGRGSSHFVVVLVWRSLDPSYARSSEFYLVFDQVWGLMVVDDGDDDDVLCCALRFPLSHMLSGGARTIPHKRTQNSKKDRAKKAALLLLLLHVNIKQLREIS